MGGYKVDADLNDVWSSGGVRVSCLALAGRRRGVGGHAAAVVGVVKRSQQGQLLGVFQSSEL